MRSRGFSFAAFVLVTSLVPLLITAPARAEDPSSDFWPKCTAKKAERLGKKAHSGKPAELINAAACYASVLLHGKGGDKESLATKGAKLARKAVSQRPNSAKAQYLLAVLIGLEAKFDPFYEQMADGLAMIPKIRKHAAKAAKLNPKINHGGPDRSLGELYMQAPSPPVSIGDHQKAIAHFRKAVKAAPKFPENRYELAKALLKQQETKLACKQLKAIHELPHRVQSRHRRIVTKANKIRAHHCQHGGSSLH